MNTKKPSWIKFLLKSPENQKLLAQEEAILQVTETICQLMDEQNVSKADLASMMNTNTRNITKILNGERNLTIREISDIFFYLKHNTEINANKR